MILFQRLNSPPSRHTHLHAFHELVYVISGDYVVEVDGDRLRLDPGMSIVYPAECPHTNDRSRFGYYAGAMGRYISPTPILPSLWERS